MTDFIEVAKLLDGIRVESSRKKKVTSIASFLRKLEPMSIYPATLFVSGRVFSETDSRNLNLSWKGISKAMEEAFGIKPDDLAKYYDGDAGEAVENYLKQDDLIVQSTLFSEPLTIRSVFRDLSRLASYSGKGSKKAREGIVQNMISEASPQEAKYIVSLLLGDLRTGVSEGLVLECISEAFEIDSHLIRRALGFLGDIGRVAEIAAVDGQSGIEEVKIEIFTPIKPMLAVPIDNPEELLESEDGPFSFEPKYDGARVQIHINKNSCRIFSRRLLEVTDSLPDIVHLVRSVFLKEDAIFDGEVIAVNENGVPYPFQVVMRRFGRTKGTEEASRRVKLQLRVFDILYLNSEMLVDDAYFKRRVNLIDSLPEEYVTPSKMMKNIDSIQEMFSTSKKQGHEGLMIKKINSPYQLGKRGRYWFKLKHNLETLDLVIVAAEWGHGRRNDWLSDYHLAVYDSENGDYVMIGKTFKGLTDAEFEQMTRRLLSLETSRSKGIVTVKPEVVVEVLASEIQDSPTYESGMALRFARIVHIRDDKAPSDATTLEDLHSIYSSQFKYKAKLE
ncbi:MAG: ATP-dependent DNA ligase [Candidatus Lokiarchaeota archaeon]|nr:ATP-dependent DNA ligase [Candidatus Lokiarchaeota archaeon]